MNMKSMRKGHRTGICESFGSAQVLDVFLADISDLLTEIS